MSERLLPELIDPVENSSREVVELCAEVECLRRENLEFRQQVGYWQSRHRDALLRNAALEQKIEQLEGEKRQLQADLFGRRSETKPLVDRSITWTIPRTTPSNLSENGVSNGEPRTQRSDDSGLTVREQFVDLPPEQCVCRIAVNRYVSAVIPKIPSKSRSTCVPTAAEWPAAVRADLHLRRETHLHCPTCSKLIPKGRYGISLWVEILLDKYFTYRPTECLVNAWRLLGLDLAPGTSPMACGGWKSCCGRFTRR